MRSYIPVLLWLSLCIVCKPAPAAVDVVTVPTREGTQLTIYNCEDVTMVRAHFAEGRFGTSVCGLFRG